MPLTRREFLLDGIASGIALPGISGGQVATDYPFRHGVASGDPLSDSVIIWTRISPKTPQEYVNYHWVIATDSRLQNLVHEGYGVTGGERDHTVKIDVTSLQPGRSYFYAFEAYGQWSDVGRTRTLPEGRLDHLRLAFTSCSNYAQGYFNVYRELATRTDLDAVLHLGDYIYEYASINHSLKTGRIHEPMHEITSLQDYRQRHACYKADKDSIAVHRQHPFIVIWDDHEIANNAWQGGAQNHQPLTEGNWQDRLNDAVQAYFEWMPIREPEGDKFALYRGYRFGDLLDLSILDTRLAGRDKPAETLEERNDPNRTLLGYEQEAWLDSRLHDAQQQGVTWKLCGQQVMVGQLGTNDKPFNYDQWDGYPAARQRLFDSVKRHQVDNWVVLTGDIHSSWAMSLHEDPFQSMQQPLGVELVTPATTSAGLSTKATADVAAASLESVLPHLNFVELFYRGYVLLDITPERLQAEWWVVNRVDSPRYRTRCINALAVGAGSSEFTKVDPLDSQEKEEKELPNFSADLAYLREWSPSGLVQQHTMIAANKP